MTNTPPIHIELPRIFLNQSRWKSYQDCNRLYAWEYVQGITPDRQRKPLVFGSAVHKAQVQIHQAGVSEDSIKAATVAAQDYFQKNMRSLSVMAIPGEDIEIQKGTELLGKLLPQYYKHWAGLGQVWKPLGQELSFCVEVGEGTNVFLVGTIDNLVTLSGSLWLVDYKTMGKLDMREFIKYEIDIQLTAYIYGGTKQLSLSAKAQGKPPVMIRGAIIDGIVKTEEPQFHREIYTRSIQDLREFELEFCMKAWEIGAKEANARSDKASYDAYTSRMWELGQSAGWKVVFPKNTQQCFRYGTCSHRDLCVSDTPTRRLSYKVRTPDYVDAARTGTPAPMEKP